MSGWRMILLLCLASLSLSVAGCGGGGDGSSVTGVTASAKKVLSITDLGTLDDGFGNSRAFGINDKGEVVGESTTSAGATHAFIWRDGVMTDLGTLGGNFSRAYAINDRGQIVGQTITTSGAWHAFIWQDGVMTDLGTLGGDSIAFSINEEGQVVGLSVPSAQTRYAFLWKDGVMTPLVDLMPGENFGSANAINDKGEVVGWSSYAFDPVFWKAGAITAIGALGSGEARGINNKGQVAGYYSPAIYEGNYTYGFIWQDGVLIDLASLGGFHSAAYAINDRGQVAGYSTTSADEEHAVLWSDY